MKQKILFFDIDNTLWDFHLGASEALKSIFPPERCGAMTEEFFRLNSMLWKEYALGHITLSEVQVSRFVRLFGDEKRGREASDRFLATYCDSSAPVENAPEIIHRLAREYRLGIITNGTFGRRKLVSIGINDLFELYLDNSVLPVPKPDPAVFAFAAEYAGALPSECAYIGDDYFSDMSGAIRAGFVSVFFDRENEGYTGDAPSHTIRHLNELCDIFL